MKKINIYYFSGTFNTKYVVSELKKKLESFDVQVKIYSCENKIIDYECDMIGIAFPIHSSYAPKIFEEFLANLPNVENKKLFGIVTSGYVAGDVLNYYTVDLMNKGYDPFLYRNIVVGNNLHLPKICPLKVTDKKVLEKRKSKINSELIDISKKIINLETDIRGNNILGRIFGFVQRFIKDNFEEKMFKGFYTSNECTQCKWCIVSCPRKNIKKINDGIFFEENCILCMRCYNGCPNFAIQYTKKTLDRKKYKRYYGIRVPKN